MFKMIAMMEAVAIGDPNKYCTKLGNECKNSSGIKASANAIIIGTAMIYISFSVMTTFLITCNPLIEMIPQMIIKTPPMTEAGIAEIRAANLPEKPNTKNQIPTAINTRRLATPVIEMIPAFVE